MMQTKLVVKKSSECTLILTEGDSAKAMAIAGLSVVGRDLYGVFPLRGKVINAREKVTTKLGKAQVMNNQELIYMKQILGLEQDAIYKDTSKLRYGHIMIMTDQDYDGSHIKGLIINWLDTFWPDLLKIQGFIQCMQTPIVKMLQKKKEILFYSIRKYEEWKEAHQIIQTLAGKPNITRDWVQVPQAKQKDILKTCRKWIICGMTMLQKQ